MQPMTRLASLFATLVFVLFLLPVRALAVEPEFLLTVRDHRFEPAELIVPAGQKLRLIVENLDSSAEEFESYSLNREKIVPARGRIVVYVGPLKPGRYEFFGEFNPSTARGALLVK